MKIPMMAFAAFLLAVSLPATSTQATQSAAHDAQTKSPTVIHTRAELERYLKTTRSEASSLNAFSPGAKKRLIKGLQYQDGIIIYIPLGDIQNELTKTQARKVLELFGQEELAASWPDNPKPVRGPAIESPLERSFDAFYFAIIRPPEHDAAAPRSHYDTLMSTARRLGGIEHANDYELTLLYRAAYRMVGRTNSPGYLDDMQRELHVLSQRGLASPDRISNLYNSFIAARRFSDADTIAKQYPAVGIAALPPLKQASNLHDGNPTVLVMEPDGKSMLRKPIDMQAPLRIVVVAGCHYSVDAVRAIRADPQGGKLFHEHAIWLANDSESLPAVLDWNRQYTDQAMNVAWRNSEWTMLDSWGMPTFYVFRHGKLVDQWSGWGDTGMQTLRAHLSKDGLLN